MISLKNGDHAIIEFSCGCKIHYRRKYNKTKQYRRWCHTNKCESQVKPVIKDYQWGVDRRYYDLDQP